MVAEAVAEAVGPAQVFEQARDSAEFWVAAPSGLWCPWGGRGRSPLIITVLWRRFGSVK